MIPGKGAPESGVSPVVGVMLMLVVAILLVAVFAVAATTLFSPQDAPINAEIRYVDTTADDRYVFEMISGDAFKKSRLNVVLRLRDDPSASIVRSGSQITATRDGDTVVLGDRLLVAEPTEFPVAGKYVVWMFYDTGSGTLVSSGEIPPA